jgi:hypothetical protein
LLLLILWRIGEFWNSGLFFPPLFIVSFSVFASHNYFLSNLFIILLTISVFLFFFLVDSLKNWRIVKFGTVFLPLFIVSFSVFASHNYFLSNLFIILLTISVLVCFFFFWLLLCLLLRVAANELEESSTWPGSALRCGFAILLRNLFFPGPLLAVSLPLLRGKSDCTLCIALSWLHYHRRCSLSLFFFFCVLKSLAPPALQNFAFHNSLPTLYTSQIVLLPTWTASSCTL